MKNVADNVDEREEIYHEAWRGRLALKERVRYDILLLTKEHRGTTFVQEVELRRG